MTIPSIRLLKHSKEHHAFLFDIEFRFVTMMICRDEFHTGNFFLPIRTVLVPDLRTSIVDRFVDFLYGFKYSIRCPYSMTYSFLVVVALVLRRAMLFVTKEKGIMLLSRSKKSG